LHYFNGALAQNISFHDEIWSSFCGGPPIFNCGVKHPGPEAPHSSFMDRQTVPIRGRLLWLLIATSFGFVVVQLDVMIVNIGLHCLGWD
jgi:hypothetical protein